MKEGRILCSISNTFVLSVAENQIKEEKNQVNKKLRANLKSVARQHSLHLIGLFAI